MKLVHDLQPLGVHQTKIHKSSDPNTSTCPCCRNQLETQLHLLQCTSNPDRKKAIAAMNSSTRKSDGNRFSLVLGDILDQWLACPEQTPSLIHRRNPYLRHEFYPHEYIELIHKALAEQAEIGWLNLFRGYLSKQWLQLASSHFGPDDNSDSIINRNDGANRVHRAIKIIHKLTTAIWKSRNEALHGVERDSETRRLSAIDNEITQLHSEADLVLHDDRFYCESSLNRLLKSSAANKRRWLVRVKASRQRKAAFLSTQPRITKYFPSGGRPADPLANRMENQTSQRNTTTQQLMTEQLHERAPNRHTSARNKTTQQLITMFLQERAPNHPLNNTATPSPSPSTTEID